MPNWVHDTRLLVEALYSQDPEFQRKANVEKRNREKIRFCSGIDELYRLTLSREGRETAKIRVSLLQKSYKVIAADGKVAQVSAELRHKYSLSMGDSIIAATAAILNAVIVFDDSHFK